MARSRIQWVLWGIAAVALVALCLYPATYRITRIATLGMAFVVWFGLLHLAWRVRWLRFSMIGFTVLAAGFLAAPARGSSSKEKLRGNYLAALRQYDGVRYFWGGESPLGIDCSGLTRRGLMDTLFREGLLTCRPELVRTALGLWWNDCTAMALGDGHQSLTVPILETPSLNELDHSRISPGDLAVTRNGVHIMAYLGDNRWIEADPGAGKVIVVAVPSDNSWFGVPMKIVRWTILQ